MAKKINDSRHPIYDELYPTWVRMSLAYHGGDAVIQSQATFWKHMAEKPESYARRQKNASYENLLESVIEKRKSIIYRKKVDREETETFKETDADIDGRGTTRDEWIKNQVYDIGEYMGYCPVYVEKRAEDDRLICVIIPPEDLVNWSADERGKLIWILIKREFIEQESPLQEPKKIIEYIHITHTETTRYRKTKEGDFVVFEEPISHSDMDYIPLVVYRDKPLPNDTVAAKSTLVPANSVNLKIFNFTSWYDTLIEKTNMQFLAEESAQNDEKTKVIGEDYIYTVDPGANFPAWVSPDITPADIFDRRIKEARGNVFFLAGLDAGMETENAVDLSGVAYSYRRAPTEDMASRKASGLQSFERELDDMIARRMGKESDRDIMYPFNFGVQSTKAALEVLDATERSRTLPQSVKARIAAQVIYTDGFSGLPDSELEELKQDILDFNPQAAQLEQREREVEIEGRLVPEKPTAQNRVLQLLDGGKRAANG